MDGYSDHPSLLLFFKTYAVKYTQDIQIVFAHFVHDVPKTFFQLELIPILFQLCSLIRFEVKYFVGFCKSRRSIVVIV